MKRLLTAVSVLLVLVLSVGGCSGARNETAPSASSTARSYSGMAAPAPETAVAQETYDYEVAMDDAAYEKADYDQANISTGGGEMGAPPSGSGVIRQSDETRKIVYTADVSLQTKDFDGGVSAVEKMTEAIGGYMQHSNVQGHSLYDPGYHYGRWAYFTVRVPEAKLQEFLDGLSADFNVGSTSIYSTDITLDYFDVKARLESLEIQRERLLEMLEQATEVEYLIEVQKEFSRVNYEIETFTSSLNRLDDSINYSTVNLNIEEVIEYSELQPVTAPFGEQISGTFSSAWRGFVTFCRNTVLFFVGITPFLAFAVPIAIAVILLLRYRKKRRVLKDAPLQEETTPKENQ